MHQQLALAAFLMAKGAAVVNAGDMRVDQVKRAIFNAGIAFGDIPPADAQAFHFRTFKHDAAFQRIFNGIVIPCAPVLGDGLVVRV